MEDSMKTLSPREMDIARLVADGLGDQEIAGKLTLSIHTVRSYLDRISQKLDVDKSPHRRRRVIREWVRSLSAA